MTKEWTSVKFCRSHFLAIDFLISWSVNFTSFKHFSDLRQLRNMDFNPVILHQCPLCPYESYEENILLEHIRDIHPEGSMESCSAEEANVQCPVCFLDFDSIQKLNDHIDNDHFDEDEYEEITHVTSNEEPAVNQPSPIKQDIQLSPNPQNKENNMSPKSTSTDDGMEQTFPCIICKKEFDSEKALIQHFGLHYEASKESSEQIDDDFSNKDAEKSKSDERSESDSSKKDSEKSKSKIPAINDIINFRGENVDFVFLLLEMCVNSARTNVYECYSALNKGEPFVKWTRSNAIELLEKHYPEAKTWNKTTLSNQIAKAESIARELKMTKIEAHKTGMGSLDSLNDPNLMPKRKRSNYKVPSTEREKDLMNMITELDQIREDLREIKSPRQFQSRANKNDEDKNPNKMKKANSFFNSISKKPRRDVNPQDDEFKET